MGVLITIAFGAWKMGKELAFSAQQATIERDQSREESSLDRKYQAEQAHQERITKARREAYLEVVSEMVKAQTALVQLPTQDIEKLDVVTSFNGLITAVSKVSILGEMETVLMSRDLLNIIHQSLFKLLARLNPIHEVKLETKYNEDKVTEVKASIDRLILEIDDELETSNDRSHIESLRKRLQSRQDSLNRYGEATLAAKLQLISMHRSYGEEVIAETLAIRLKVDELVSSIRSELSLTTSLEQLHATTRKAHDLTQTATKKLQSSLDQVPEGSGST